MDDLSADLAAARAQIATLRAALELYADSANYERGFYMDEQEAGAGSTPSWADDDRGARARAALSDASNVGRVVEAARVYKRLHEAYQAAIPKAKYPEKMDTYELTEALRALFGAVAAMEGGTT